MPRTDLDTSYPSVLLRIEETVKEKNTLGLSELLELKKFRKKKKTEYAENICRKLLPNLDQSRLKVTVHYVSSSLKARVQRQVKNK